MMATITMAVMHGATCSTDPQLIIIIKVNILILLLLATACMDDNLFKFVCLSFDLLAMVIVHIFILILAAE